MCAYIGCQAAQHRPTQMRTANRPDLCNSYCVAQSPYSNPLTMHTFKRSCLMCFVFLYPAHLPS